MRQVFRSAALTLALAVLTAAFAVGQNPSSKPGDPKDLPQSGQVSGKLAQVGGSSKLLTLQIEQQLYEPNPNAQKTGSRQIDTLYRRMAEIQRDQMDIMRSRNPRQAMQRMAELQRDMAQLQLQLQKLGADPKHAPFKLVTKKQDYEIAADDNTRVLFKDPPVVFDDKGNIKKYTDAELKEMKDPKNPSYYKGSFDQLKPGHLVTVLLGKRPASKSKDSKDSKDLDKTPADDDKPYAAVIAVTGEDSAPQPPPKKKNKE
jgi:hypothetical protein